MSKGIIEGRHLSQICCLDNEETDTQASIWADFTHRQVSLDIVIIDVIVSQCRMLLCNYCPT